MARPPTVIQLYEVHKEGIVRAPRTGDEEDLVRGLQARKGWAERALLERYSAYVERILTHLLGSHSDLDDLALEVFWRALDRLKDLRDPSGLKPWLRAFAVNVAREARRSRRRRWWQVLRPPEETPTVAAPSASAEDRAALRAFYAVLDTLDVDACIAFVLRYVEGMELTEIAEVCGVSLATIKRRIKAAENEFCARGRTHHALAGWFEKGPRWRQPTS